MSPPPAGIDLFWLPLGAGGRVVRWNGRVYERIAATVRRRPVRALYHSALVVHLPPDDWAVEMTPVWGYPPTPDRGVTGEGAVGARVLGRSRWFRYEVHCWRGGTVGDVADAVGGPVRVTSDPDLGRRLLQDVLDVPLPVWGRDGLRTGEGWNSNSVTSWLLARIGLDAAAWAPPAGGRAPGWRAGVEVAARAQPAVTGWPLHPPPFSPHARSADPPARRRPGSRPPPRGR